MKVGDRVVFIDDNKSMKGLVMKVIEGSRQSNWVISWENGRTIIYTNFQMDELYGVIIRKDFQYYRMVKLEELGI